MDHDELLARHLALCKQVGEQMKRKGNWPWMKQAVRGPKQGEPKIRRNIPGH